MRIMIKWKLPLALAIAMGFSTACTSDEEQVEEPIAVEETTEEALEPPPMEDPALEDPSLAAVDSSYDIASTKVYFGFDQASLTTDAQLELEKMAAHLSSNPDLKIQITGHADERGTNEYNMALGEQRAYAVKNFLINQGIGADRLTTVSMGEESPAQMGSGEDVWSLNRRAEFSAAF